MFSKNFLWGSATSAAQVEGAWNVDGRSPSIWDIASTSKIKNGENCHNACDHYFRYKDDIALMKKIGLKAYRFSVSWSRVMTPQNTVNERGLLFYVNLVDELLKNGIEPILTLFHWDMPEWIYKMGGFMNKKTIELFADYVRVVTEALSSKVKYWITLNEPSVFMGLGYSVGVHAPFEKQPWKTPILFRNILLYHLRAVQIIRYHSKADVKIGISLVANAFIPKNESDEEIEKAKRITFSNSMKMFDCNIWADLILKGTSDDELTNIMIGKDVMSKCCPKIDFLGVNIYRPLNYSCERKYRQKPSIGIERNSLGWELCPSSIYWLLRFFYERYEMPIMITENGMCACDAPLLDGSIKDGHRIAYLQKIFRSLQRATDENIDIIGYNYWSLMDNFEWAEGYDPRFGLIYVDYKTQERTIKYSGYYYKEVIESNGQCI